MSYEKDGGSKRTLIMPSLRHLLLLIAILGIPSRAVPQTTTFGAIEGTVRDETGGALPGVTIEVTSPALQVKALSVVSDVDGRYRVPDLRVGTYALRAELEGFNAFVREGLQISVGFVARVDVALKLGSLSETITVSGASPVVDVTTTRGGQTINTQAVAKAIPLVGHQVDIVKLTPGLSGGLGTRAGNPTQMGLQANISVSAYGQSGVTAMVEDLSMHSNNQPPMLGGTEQMDIKTYGNTAEIQNPGAAMNYVFSSGGNQYTGRVMSYAMSDKTFQAQNVDDALRKQGFTSSEALKNYYDVQGFLGGRIVRDKLWFFASGRNRRTERTVGGFALSPGPDGLYLTGDEPPAYPWGDQKGTVVKFSNQLTSKTLLTGLWWGDKTNDVGSATSGYFGGANPRTIPFEASSIYGLKDTVWSVGVKGTPMSRLAYDIKAGRVAYQTHYDIQPGSEDLPTRWNRNTGLYTGSPISNGTTTAAQRAGKTFAWESVGSLTIVPSGRFMGAHQFKVGYRTMLTTSGGAVPNHPAGNYALIYDTIGGVPNTPVEIVTFSFPFNATNRLNMHGAYVQDQWRLGDRLTANIGLRFERFNAWVPPQEQIAGQFATAQSYSKIPVGAWNMLAPRAALAWDLSGNGKTVIKSTWGIFHNELEWQASQFTTPWNPVSATATQYRWHDLNNNSNYDPGEVDLSLTGTDFLSVTSAANMKPLSNDFYVPVTYEATASIERELIPNMAGRILYVYKRVNGTYSTVNTGRPYAAYNIPLTRRDPGPDGSINTADDGPTVTIYDFDAAYRSGQYVVNERVNAPNPDVAQTIEGSVTKRMSNGWSLTGAFAATKQHRWLTSYITNPNEEYFPVDESWSNILRVNGSYTLPWQIELGGTLAVKTGVLGQRTVIYRAADPLGGPSLKQQTTVTLRAEPFGSTRGPVQRYLDFRLGKSVSIFGRRSLLVSADILNALNANIPEAITYLSGPQFGQVTLIPPPRVVRFGIQFDF